MKPKRIYYFCAAVALCAFVGYSVAQLVDSTPSPDQVKLDQAAILIADGKAIEARELIATIPETVPEYRIGRFYDALAIHVVGDQIGFVKALEKLPKDATGVPADVSEDLAAREVQALHYFRKFEALLPKARAFVQNHAGSARYAKVQDCLIAGLFDRGMKQTDDACRFNDETNFNIRWPDAKANLEEFLALVASTGVTNYQSLPKRNLKQDIWVARLTLGDENALWGEVPATDVASREQLSFLRLRLYQRIQKEEIDKNIKLANEFFELFPESAHRKRVEYELAGVAIYGGTRLAEQSRSESNVQKRATAGRYLELARELYSRVVEDKVAGISAADVQQSRVAMLRICFALEDWAGLSDWAEHLIATSPPEEKVWVLSKLYLGVGLARQGKTTEAANELDQVLDIGFKGHPSYDGHLISAVKWRIYLARTSDDLPKARELMQWVKESNCRGSTKNPFLWEYRGLLQEETTSPK